jgi:hypothetical protein
MTIPLTDPFTEAESGKVGSNSMPQSMQPAVKSQTDCDYAGHFESLATFGPKSQMHAKSQNLRDGDLPSNLVFGDKISSSNEDKNALKVLADYSKYLYEEELKRSERYHGAMKTYLVFISLTFSGTIAIAKWLEIHPAIFFAKVMILPKMLLAGFIFLALAFLVASFIFTILVIKVWRTERLCSPKLFALETSNELKEDKLTERIISNYVIAAERNGQVNEQKGQLLASASILYRIGLCFLLCAAITYLLM